MSNIDGTLNGVLEDIKCEYEYQLDTDIEKDLFQRTFQRLTFAYSIALPDLCRYTKWYKYMVSSEEDAEFFDDDYSKFNFGYARLLRRMCTEGHPMSRGRKYVDKNKIYDSFLMDGQVMVYNAMARVTGFPAIEKVLPNSLIKDAATLDGATLDYSMIAKHYPYYNDNEREGFDFLEFILLINLYSSVQYRSLNVLEWNTQKGRELTLKQKKILEKTVKKVIETMNKQEMYSVYVFAVLDSLDYFMCEKYNKEAESYIRTVVLPERLKNRKDAFRAFATHIKDEIKMYVDEYEKNQIDNITKTGTAIEVLKMKEAISQYTKLEYVDSKILPLVVAILLNKEIDLEDIEEYKDEYEMAKKYANIIKMYIDKSVLEAENILKKLYCEG